jgi:hypothetical protein
MGKNQSSTEEGCIVSPLRIQTNSQAMKVTLEDAVSLLSKYVEERTPVLAVFVTPSVSVPRVTGTIQISVVDGVTPHLIIGKEDGASDQIKFRLSDCTFEYGDFRDAIAEDFGAHKFDGFLVVASSGGDTLSLFEMKRQQRTIWKSADFECSNGLEPSRLSEPALSAIVSSRFPRLR